MGQRYLRFTYPPELVTEPIIYQLSRQFEISTNIRRANVTRDGGWVILELLGDDREVDRAVDWASARGLSVEPVAGETLD